MACCYGPVNEPQESECKIIHWATRPHRHTGPQTDRPTGPNHLCGIRDILWRFHFYTPHITFSLLLLYWLLVSKHIFRNALSNTLYSYLNLSLQRKRVIWRKTLVIKNTSYSYILLIISILLSLIWTINVNNYAIFKHDCEFNSKSTKQNH